MFEGTGKYKLNGKVIWVQNITGKPEWWTPASGWNDFEDGEIEKIIPCQFDENYS